LLRLLRLLRLLNVMNGKNKFLSCLFPLEVVMSQAYLVQMRK
jgi:hypothetical protein